MFTIPTNVLKASIICAATKDIRYYLCSIYLKSEGEKLHIVSTDGHRLSKFTVTYDGSEPVNIIVPIDAAKQAAKSKTDIVRIDKLSDAKFSIGTAIFKPIDAVYPDYNLVIPITTSGEFFEF